jgi:hypothetical protein
MNELALGDADCNADIETDALADDDRKADSNPLNELELPLRLHPSVACPSSPHTVTLPYNRGDSPSRLLKQRSADRTARCVVCQVERSPGSRPSRSSLGCPCNNYQPARCTDTSDTDKPMVSTLLSPPSMPHQDDTTQDSHQAGSTSFLSAASRCRELRRSVCWYARNC